MWHISLRFSGNSEADASELPENRREMFPHHVQLTACFRKNNPPLNYLRYKPPKY